MKPGRPQSSTYQTVSLQDAVEEILLARDSDARHSSPYFFVVGAGISSPSVPLSVDMVAHFRKICQQHRSPSEVTADDTMAQYSAWFSAAYPHPVQRQRYLDSLIRNQPVSHANLRLAHLLSSGKVGNLVVTSNFDDFLSRSLALFGEPHTVCDDPENVQRINPDNLGLQIVHVHGTYWFYDCCNLLPEINERATSSAMASLLDTILANRSPIVVGYSGWKQDVIMTALKRRLARRLPYNMYWFCYRQADAQDLPAWLVNHPDVRLVAPRPEEEMRVSGRPMPSSIVEPVATVPLLPAHQVFGELIRSLALSAPALTTNPLHFFTEVLRRTLPTPSDSMSDFYHLKSVIDRVENASLLQSELEKQLEHVLDSSRRCQYEEAITLAFSTQYERMTEDQREEFLSAIVPAADNLQGDKRIGGYELAVAVLDSFAADKPVSETRVELKARCLVELGLACKLKGEWEKALRALKNGADIYEGRKSTKELLEVLAFELGCFEELNLGAEAVEVLDRIIKVLTEDGRSETGYFAECLHLRCIWLQRSRRNRDALQAADDIFSRSLRIPQWEGWGIGSRALVQKAEVLLAMNRRSEAIRTYDLIIQRYAKSPHFKDVTQVERALAFKGVELLKEGLNEQAISAFEQVEILVGQFPITRDYHVTMSRMFKGVALTRKGDVEKGLELLDEVVTLCLCDEDDTEVFELGLSALIQKGLALADIQRHDEARAIYKTIVTKYKGKAERSLLKELRDVVLSSS